MDPFVHKHGYDFLFKHKAMLRELLESFVDPALIADLDLESMEPQTEKHYISNEFTDFYDDLFVKTRLKGREAYIYVFVEFQSTNDRYMALRILNYILLFYLDWLKENKRKKLLPPVLPIVLYNGKFKWKAPENLIDLIEPNQSLQRYYPSFRYLKIIESDYGKEELLAIGNAVAGVFLLENAGREDLGQLLQNLNQVLSCESVEVVRIFTLWLRHLLRNGRTDDNLMNTVTSLRNSKEEKGMLVETIKLWEKDLKEAGRQEGKQQGRREGREKGRKEGREEGREEGQEIALRLLAQKMKHAGEIPEKIAEYTGLSQEEIGKL